MISSRSVRTILLAAVLASPLALTGCEELMGETEENYDGTYTLVSVNGQSISPNGYVMHDYGPANRMVLTQGRWTISGSTLSTYMAGYQIISGSRSNWSESHTGTITVSGSTASAVLDRTGTRVTAQMGTGYLVTGGTNSAQLRFTKN